MLDLEMVLLQTATGGTNATICTPLVVANNPPLLHTVNVKGDYSANAQTDPNARDFPVVEQMVYYALVVSWLISVFHGRKPV